MLARHSFAVRACARPALQWSAEARPGQQRGVLAAREHVYGRRTAPTGERCEVVYCILLTRVLESYESCQTDEFCVRSVPAVTETASKLR